MPLNTEQTMTDYLSLIQHLQSTESEVIAKELAGGEMMLGRMVPRLEKDCIPKFQAAAWQYAGKLLQISSLNDFDAFHREFVAFFRQQIKNKDGEDASYGEAQKPINLFLKSYVDRFAIPGETVRQRLRPFLHVPLDSVIIGYFRSHFSDDYKRHIGLVHAQINEFIKDKNPQFSGKIPDGLLSQLQHLHEREYFAWQHWFREIHPPRPVLIDNLWFFERPKASKSA